MEFQKNGGVMADRMLELYTHGQIVGFVVDEATLPEEHCKSFDAHLSACEICGPVYRTGWGRTDSEPCGPDVFKQFLSFLVPEIRKRNLLHSLKQ